MFLQGHGISTTYGVKIYKQYGKKTIENISKILTGLQMIYMESDLNLLIK